MKRSFHYMNEKTKASLLTATMLEPAKYAMSFLADCCKMYWLIEQLGLGDATYNVQELVAHMEEKDNWYWWEHEVSSQFATFEDAKYFTDQEIINRRKIARIARTGGERSPPVV